MDKQPNERINVAETAAAAHARGLREGDAAATERACKIECLGCFVGLPLQLVHPEWRHKHGDYYPPCTASAIRLAATERGA